MLPTANETAVQNPLFPVFLKLENMRLLLVGGGYIALEKITAVVKNSPQTQVRVVATEFRQPFLDFVADNPNVVLVQKPYDESDLLDTDVVIAATGNRDLAQQIRLHTQARHIWLNAADMPALCDFYLGSIVQKGYLKIAISTNGKSPTMAKRLRETFEEAFPEQLNDVLENLGELRQYLSGDFSQKVQQLNDITAVMVRNGNTKTTQPACNWQHAAIGLGLLLLGFGLGKI